MFSSMLVPLDGSTLAERALQVAVPIAQSTRAQLHLASVRQALPESGPAQHDVEQSYLDRMADLLRRQLPQPVRHALLVDEVAGRPMGHPPRRAIGQVLADYVRQQNIDLTVMTTHGRGGLTRAYLGSVAEAFVRYSSAPALLFRPDGLPPQISHLLVLVDGSRESHTIVHAAIDLAQAVTARATLLHVVSDPSQSYDAMCELTELSAAFDEAGVRSQVVIRVASDPATAILAFVPAFGIDAIALTTRTRNSVQRVLFGSVADLLARKAGVPILVSNPFVGGRVGGSQPDAEAAVKQMA